METIKFLQKYGKFEEGSIHSVEATKAADLIADGVAEKHVGNLIQDKAKDEISEIFVAKLHEAKEEIKSELAESLRKNPPRIPAVAKDSRKKGLGDGLISKMYLADYGTADERQAAHNELAAEFCDWSKVDATDKSLPTSKGWSLNTKTTQVSSVGIYGGFAMPNTINSSLSFSNGYQNPLTSRISRDTCTGETYSDNYLDQSVSTTSGVSVTVQGETATFGTSTTKLGRFSVQPARYGTSADESLIAVHSNPPALDRMVNEQIVRAIYNKVERDALINTTGKGCQGIAYAPGRFLVNRKDASKIQWVDIMKLRNRIDPEFRNDAIILASPAAEEQLQNIKDDSGRTLTVFSAAERPVPTIAGHPYFVSNYLSDLGTEADILMVVPQFVLGVDRMPLTISVSDQIGIKSGLITVVGQTWTTSLLRIPAPFAYDNSWKTSYCTVLGATA